MWAFGVSFVAYPLHLAPVPAAGEYFPSGEPMGAENGPEAAFGKSNRDLAQRWADPPAGPSGGVLILGIFCQSVQLETVEKELFHGHTHPGHRCCIHG